LQHGEDFSVEAVHALDYSAKSAAAEYFADNMASESKKQKELPAHGAHTSFHQGVLTGTHKLTRPRLVTASTGPLAFLVPVVAERPLAAELISTLTSTNPDARGHAAPP
jgi:hypothetical protein